MVRVIKAKGVAVLLMSPPLTNEASHSYFTLEKTGPFLRECVGIMREVTKAEGVNYIPVQEEFVAFQERLPAGIMLSPDGVHPASLGQYNIARSLTPITLIPTRMRAERKAERQNTVVDELRQRIVRGDLAPGERLPIRLDIEGEFNASAITVQRALDQLREEGFVLAQRRSGTYVVEEPPHLSHYALVFQSKSSSPDWEQFWTALCNEAPHWRPIAAAKFSFFMMLIDMRTRLVISSWFNWCAITG